MQSSDSKPSFENADGDDGALVAMLEAVFFLNYFFKGHNKTFCLFITKTELKWNKQRWYHIA